VPDLLGIVTVGVLGAAVACTIWAAIARDREGLMGGVLFCAIWAIPTVAAIVGYGSVE
jgi:hypothetical protein